MYENWRIFLYYVLKNPPNELLLCCVHCTVYTETPYHECTRSHQLRTMTLRSHINSVPWMIAVTPTPYHECTQFADSVKSLSFRLTRGFFGPIAYIHGTELVWLRSFMVRSWCNLVRGWCDSAKSLHVVSVYTVHYSRLHLVDFMFVFLLSATHNHALLPPPLVNVRRASLALSSSFFYLCGGQRWEANFF
jgi:hypothetical protein